MKRIFSLFLLLCGTAVLLAACGATPAAEEAPPVEAADSETAAPTAAPTVPPTAPPTVPPTAADEPASTDTSDLSLIGQTGRPQFLNAYASW